MENYDVSGMEYLIGALKTQGGMNKVEHDALKVLIETEIKQEENLKVLNETVLMLIEEVERLRTIIEK